MKKIFKLFIFICLFSLCLAVTGCDLFNKESNITTVSTVDAYDAIKTSLSGTITNTNALSAKFVGNVTLNLEEAEGMEFEKANVDICIQMKADENKKLTDRCCWIKLGDDESSLILESYVKDGYEYSFTNLFGEYYGYEKADVEEEFDVSDIDLTQVNSYIDDLMQYFPEPTAKKNNKENLLDIVWTVNLDNLATYVAAIQYVVDNGNLTFEEILAEKQKDIDGGKEGFTAEDSFIRITLKEGHFYQIEVKLKATKGEQIVDINLNCEFEYDDFAFAYPLDRLAEIKTNKEKDDSKK